MGIFKRVGDVVSANLNDLVDQCENPEKMLRQAVREMEAALGRLMDGAARAIAHQRLLERQYERERKLVANHWQAAEAAVQRGDDEAARRDLRRNAEHQRLAETLAEQSASAAALSERLRGQVAAMRARLAEARRKQVDVTARNRAASARRQFVDRARVSDQSGAVLSAFDRICTEVDQSEAETDALLDLLGETEEQTSYDQDAEADLAALKEKMSHVAD